MKFKFTLPWMKKKDPYAAMLSPQELATLEKKGWDYFLVPTTERLPLAPGTPGRANARAAAYPRRRNVMEQVPIWTTGMYRTVCDLMRRPGSRPDGARLIGMLQAYMKHYALVAPSVPRGLSLPSPVVLWRGVQLSPVFPEVPRPGTTVSSSAGCFTALSLSKNVAWRFMAKGQQQGFMYRLAVDRIARGTPWMFLTNNNRDPRPLRTANAIKSFAPHEREVLLPPGYFKVLTVYTEPSTQLVIVDVAYAPQAEYQRRGAVPRVNTQGRVVAKTVGGHPLVMQSSSLAAGIRARRSRIAAAAARAASRR